MKTEATIEKNPRKQNENEEPEYSESKKEAKQGCDVDCHMQRFLFKFSIFPIVGSDGIMHEMEIMGKGSSRRKKNEVHSIE